MNQAVKRNRQRFPADFMFQLTTEETKAIRSQIVTLNMSTGWHRYPPYVFTEHVVAMLSSVLHSKRAITVNIQIIRMFVRLREIALNYDSLRLKLEAMEQNYDEQFRIVFDAIRKTIAHEEEPKSEIGFS